MATSHAARHRQHLELLGSGNPCVSPAPQRLVGYLGRKLLKRIGWHHTRAFASGVLTWLSGEGWWEEKTLSGLDQGGLVSRLSCYKIPSSS